MKEGAEMPCSLLGGSVPKTGSQTIVWVMPGYNIVQTLLPIRMMGKEMPSGILASIRSII